MIYSDFDELTTNGTVFGIDPAFTISNFNGKCAVDDLVAVKLSSISPKYIRNVIYDITRAGQTNALAHIITAKGEDFRFGAAGPIETAAYLEDIERLEAEALGGSYIFKSDYLIISTIEINDYMQIYREGSGLWGGFTHVEDLPVRRPNYLVPTAKPIVAEPNLAVRGEVEKDSLWRAIEHQSALERFLKMYHLIELKFDLELVTQIRALGDNLKGIGKLLNEYSGDREVDRLTRLVRKYCPEIGFFESHLRSSFSNAQYHDQLMEMLFEYPKEGNPYKEKMAAFRNMLSGDFSETEFRVHGLSWTYENVSKMATFLVYRIRCGIAHSKIGEYILSGDDEGFIVEVGEPLLQAILARMYSQRP